MRGRRSAIATAPALVLALALPLAGVAAGANEPAPEAPQSAWWVSRLTGEWRSWLPEEQFSPQPQEAPHMVIYEVTQDPYGRPSAAQEEAARRLIDGSLEAAQRRGWFRFEQAIEDGYEPMVDDRTHYVSRDFVLDGRILDPERPEFLMYYDAPEGRKLVGFMYLMSDLEEHGPQIGGPSTIWHYHIWSAPRCLVGGLLIVGPADERGACAEGVVSHRSPEMIHVWFLDHPDGPFATNMVVPSGVLHGSEEMPH